MLASLVTRALQLIFAAIVLGLSIRAAKWQMYESVPATTAFAAFAGGFTLLISLVGIASIWISAIPALIMSMVDGLASVILFAGGIAYAVKISSVDCGDTDTFTLDSTPLLTGGCKTKKHETECGFMYESEEAILGRCKVVKADTAFLFLGFAACVGAAAVCFLAHKRGRSF